MLTQYGELLGTDEVEEMLAMCPRSENGLLDYQGFVHAVENASSTVQLLSKDEA
jgi:Ca2+-binding EF-hand superfamily protein